MSKQFFIVWSVIYLIVMAVLIVGFGAVNNWFDLFTGFVIGLTATNLIQIYRERKQSRRNLR